MVLCERISLVCERGVFVFERKKNYELNLSLCKDSMGYTNFSIGLSVFSFVKRLLLIVYHPTFWDVIKWKYSIHFTGFFYSLYT
jgi:hypothetical protein